MFNLGAGFTLTDEFVQLINQLQRINRQQPAALAQSVERKALNLVVAGSSPAGGRVFPWLHLTVL